MIARGKTILFLISLRPYEFIAQVPAEYVPLQHPYEVSVSLVSHLRGDAPSVIQAIGKPAQI